MTDFLLELRSEEIPARMQDKARDDLARLFAAEIARAGLVAAAIVTYATPRRLALIARGLPAATQAVTEEVKGPKTAAPPQALDGFLRKNGLTRADLTERDGVFFAISEKPGRATAAVLGEAIPAIVRGFPWPRSMRWGAASASTGSLRWVRPLHGLIALLGEDIVPVEIAGIASGASTLGHRFHHAGAITIGSAADYVEKLRACHVVVDQDERRATIRTRAAALAADAGLELVEDEGLVAENAGLTEWPVPLLGRFDADFLSVPPEVIQLTARVNQKYFVCRDASGALANAFVCTANIAASDGGAKIVEGNRKVLAARLADARFFYDTDLKVPLADQVAKLDKIVFHEQLGTVADKVARVAALARWLVEAEIVTDKPLSFRGGVGVGTAGDSPGPAVRETRSTPPRAGGDPATLAERAARLAKADLVTGMVGEFPELQGLIGGYYAAAQGEDPQVAAAIRDHYKPVGQGDAVPDAPVTVAVSLADKLDTLLAFFSINEAPTGSKDPFALRRAALGVLALVTRHGLRLPMGTMIEQAGGAVIRQHGQRVGARATTQDMAAATRIGAEPGFILTGDYERRVAFEGEGGEMMKLMEEGIPKFAPFLLDRLKVQQREAGVRHDLIDAVVGAKDANGDAEDDLVRLLARVRALQAFVGTEDGANLLAGYKRAANILRKEGYDAAATQISLSYTPEPAETALLDALDVAEPAAAVAGEEFEAAMAALATLRAPIDAFFDSVTVNDADPDKRAARLALLARVRAAVHAVADFSRIEG